jgi:hypothetical protein
VERVEDRDAIRTAHHGLPIDRKRRAAESSRRAGDRWIALAPIEGASGEQAHLVAPHAAPAADIPSRLISCTHPGPEGALYARVGMQGGTNPPESASGKGMRQSYRLARPGGNGQIAALRRGSDETKGLGTSALALGLWWRIAVALSAALAVDASLTDNRTLAFVTVALTAALMVYAGAAIAGQRTRC